jgi:predicted DNA-binding antitoxin AbrB/MazE fold protein
MDKTVSATFDGVVFRPDEPVDLATNTRVRLIIENEKNGLELIEDTARVGR